MRIVNLHFAGSPNVGDLNSPPGRYLDLGTVMDIAAASEAEVTIYGGGSMAEAALAHLAGRRGLKIAWGIGYTERGRLARHRDPDYSAFDLAGSRDFGGAVRWVPCASCLSPLFDQAYPVTREVAFYGHRLLSPMPGQNSLNNDCLDMAQVLAHLGSGETVVTSSYHGVYWATLLGRKVVALPYGSKFFALKHQPTFADRYEGQPGRSYPEALAECREANFRFGHDVADFIAHRRIS
ncbi:MAG: hypothetical protein ABFE07_28630 [Armatimonadia bacterium]